jgi:hypothetical protein
VARLYPYVHSTRGFQHDDDPLPSNERLRGHPTAPGGRDESEPPRFPIVDASTIKDGGPGVPRVTPGRLSQGPGTPGNTPTGPKQPKTLYNGKTEEF